MADSKVITFYDITTTNGCMSPYTWKTRLALNYKKIAYKTHWLTFVGVEPYLQALGAKPTTKKPAPDDAEDWYTCPVLSIPTQSGPPKIVENSDTIAELLDADYPNTPKLFPPGTAALQYAFLQHFYGGAYEVLGTLTLPGIPGILDAENAAYVSESRARWFGSPLSEWAPVGSAKRAALWATAEATWGKLKTAVYDKRETGTDGPWLTGAAPVYADFAVVAVLGFVHATVPEEDWQQVLTWHGGFWKKLWDASLPYRAGD